MKLLLCISALFICLKSSAQLHSAIPVIPSKVQPVPNATTTDKSAPPQPINIPVAANPVPPIYPGAEAKAVEIPKQLINPPVTPSGTQPIQKEPLSPIESANILQPNRPPRGRASRENNKTVSPAVSNRSVMNPDNTFSTSRINMSNGNAFLKPVRKTTTTRSTASKKVMTKKKPR